MTNHRAVAQEVAIGFYVAVAGEFFYGDPSSETTVNLPPRSTTTYEDVTASLLGRPGALGAIVINGSYFQFHPDAELDATYRIWTRQQGTMGTMSQSSAALDLLALPAGTETRVVIGVREDTDFRCNVGIFSYTYYHKSFRVTASSESGSVTMTVKAGGYSLTQVPLPEADLGYMTVTIEPLDTVPGDLWTAYASSVDNHSGDSWLQNASPQYASPLALAGEWTATIRGGDPNDTQFVCGGAPLRGRIEQSGGAITAALSGGCDRNLYFEGSLDGASLNGSIRLVYPQDTFVGAATGLATYSRVLLKTSVRTPSWIVDGLEITLTR